MIDEPLLSAENISISFGALKAVDDMRLKVYTGEIVGIIGPNGAGKSTLVNGISGLVPLQTGRVMLVGEDISRLSSYERFRKGLGRTFQQVILAEELTVQQALSLAAARGKYIRGGRKELEDEAFQLCQQVGLDGSLNSRISSLSFMHRRLLSIVTSLAGGTKVAFLDEATAGLSRTERQVIVQVLKQLVKNHPERALVVIEHDLEFVRNVTDRSVAMVNGQHIIEASTEEVLRNPVLVEAYIGTD